jgi:hypothetical protein
VTDEQQSPVAGAQVYAYELIEVGEKAEEEAEIEDVIKGELEAESTGERQPYYDQFRGPADYVSGPTDRQGCYILNLPPGRYCLVARKRSAGKPDVGPLTPEDYSSWVSQPIEVGRQRAVRLDLTVRKLVGDLLFSAQYTIRVSNTQFKGKITDETGEPLAGLLVVANRRQKISRKPDYASLPSGKDGSFILYLPGGGTYYLGLKRELLGKPLSCQIESAYVNPEDNTLELSTGDTISGVDIICLEGEGEEE